MAPSMSSLSKRMTANPARPVSRYRPGKAVPEAPSSEDEDSNEEAEKPEPRHAQPKATSFPAREQRSLPQAHVTQQAEDDGEEGFVTEDEDEEDEGQTVEAHRRSVEEDASTGDISKPTEATENLLVEEEAARDKTRKLETAESSSGEETDEGDDESQSSSEEEAPRRTFQRPTFIKKSERDRFATTNANGAVATGEKGPITTLPNQESITAEEARRKEVANRMIKDNLERDAAARAAGRKGWDDDDEVAPEDTVDDTDGLNPEAEYTAWKLRELKRLKRDRELIEEREKTIEEIERRRNLTQTEREAEDREFVEKQKEEREEGKGKAGFLQRYHHKGAFFQDDETAEILRKRDLMGAKFVDEVKNREALPQSMQLRDMTKLGKKGKTRYTDLRGEDTGRWGQGYDVKDRKGPGTAVDVDERFRPDRDAGGGGGTRGPTGANASILQARKVGNVRGETEAARTTADGQPPTSPEDRHDSYRPARQRREASYDSHEELDGARSQFPRRRRSLTKPSSRDRFRQPHEADVGTGSRRKRSRSPYREEDKRRRVEAS